MGVTSYYSLDGEIIAEQTGAIRTEYSRDALGSVTATRNLNTDKDAYNNTYRYKPYGARLAKTGTDPDPDFQHVGTAGYRHTGLTHSGSYVRRRRYAEEEGRWTTVDPLWPWEASYTYAFSSPTLLMDFSGTTVCLEDPCKGCQGLTGDKLCDFMSGVGWITDWLQNKDNLGVIVGFTVCCGTTAAPCVWANNLDIAMEDINMSEATRKAILECVKAHEKVHGDNYPKGNVCAGSNQKGGAPCGLVAVPKDKQLKEECAGSLAEMKCLLGKFKNPCAEKGSPPKFVDAAACRRVCSVCDFMTSNCKSAGTTIPPAYEKWCTDNKEKCKKVRR